MEKERPFMLLPSSTELSLLAAKLSWPALVKLVKRPVSACERQSCLCCSKALGSELPRGRDAWAFLLPGAFGG